MPPFWRYCSDGRSISRNAACLGWISFLFVVVIAGLAYAGPSARSLRLAREVSQDLTVHIDSTGRAFVIHRSTWRVVRGPVTSFDMSQGDPTAALDPNVRITTDDGRELGAHATLVDAAIVRVVPDSPKALTSGGFAAETHWQVDLVATGGLVSEGTSLRMSFTMPASDDGLDLAKTEFDLPAAAKPPERIVDDTGAAVDAAVANLKHEPGRDILELVRPYVPSRDSVTWVVRVDPRAVPGMARASTALAVGRRDFSSSSSIASATPRGASIGERFQAAFGAISEWIVGAMGIGFGLLVARASKTALGEGADYRSSLDGGSDLRSPRFPCDCLGPLSQTPHRIRNTGTRPSPLVPLPIGLRSALAGACLSAGGVLQLTGRAMTGSLLVGVACLCAATRWEAARPPVRGPGRWVEIDSERAFGARRKFRGVSAGPHAMYVRCFLGVGAFAAIALAARGASSQSAWLAAVDSAVLVPLFVTSWPAGTYPEGVQGSDRWLLAVYARLRAYRAHLTTLCGRIVGDGSVDEVRVQVVPRLALPGLLGIEIGRAWSATEVGWSAYPEVLVRMLRESETAKKLRRLAPEALPILGRNPDERVVRLLPCAPTHGATVALARRLSAELAYPVGARPANMG